MRDIMKYLVDNVLYRTLLILVVDKILRYFVTHKRLIITYHGVSQKNQFHINGRHLSADQFEAQLKYFKKNFDVVPLEAICDMKQMNTTPKKHTIALTFDDGFLNNLTVALPLLEKYQLPATFFCCSINLEDRKYIHPSDFFNLIGVFSNNSKITIDEKEFTKHKYDLIHFSDGITAEQYINTLSYEDWKTTLSHLSEYYPPESITTRVDDEAYKLMNAEHLKQLGSSGISSIGSHCHSHVNIKMLSPEEMNEQFTLSKKQLEKYSSKSITTIAYPYGYYNKKAIELSKEMGYKYLFAAGDVEEEFKDDLFPRMAILSAASYSRNILSVNNGFTRFGF
jgi:peptidoglycan/xylan/chitin deacetylase (PgdA/CDA1 family)